jgi:hypothetical protein
VTGPTGLRHRYAHAEAYCVLTYVADDGSESEQVWNSRDGTTPFVITLRSGKPASHADWAADRRMPEDWTPPPGMRYFADLTPERARALADRNVARWISDSASVAAQFRDAHGTLEAAAAHFAAIYLEHPGTPDLIDPLLRRWAVTYRHPPDGPERTVTVDDGWQAAHNLPRLPLETPAQAAWQLALHLAAQGHEPELIRAEPA